MFSNFYNTTGAEMGAGLIIVNLIISFLLLTFIAWIYRRTHRGLSYSTSFIFTLYMVGLIGTTIMMLVQQNILGAFALLGAFGLIRFRTIVKDTRDVAFVFYALAIGIAVGVGTYVIAGIADVFIGAVILLITHYHVLLGARSSLNFILTVTRRGSGSSKGYEEDLRPISSSIKLLSLKTSGELEEYSYLLLLKNDKIADRVLETIKKKEDVVSVNLISAQEAWER